MSDFDVTVQLNKFEELLPHGEYTVDREAICRLALAAVLLRSYADDEGKHLEAEAALLRGAALMGVDVFACSDELYVARDAFNLSVVEWPPPAKPHPLYDRLRGLVESACNRADDMAGPEADGDESGQDETPSGPRLVD